MTEDQSYAFGDSMLADQRLALLAQVFEPTSAAFIGHAGPESVKYAIDLGCGPGYATRMLADAFPSASVIGLDISNHFIRSARSREHATMHFTYTT